MTTKTKRNKKYVYGKPLNYNAGAQGRYVSVLVNLVRDMAKEVNREIIMFFKSPVPKQYFLSQEIAAMDASVADDAAKLMNKLQKKFEALFSKKSLPISETMVKEMNRSSESALKLSIKELANMIGVQPNFIPSGVKEALKAAIADNVSVIKTIPVEYFRNITNAVMRSITTGTGVDQLITNLEKYYGSSTKKAYNVAMDQTRKAYNSINKQRMINVGYKKFEWLHSGGGLHPRKYHIEMNGKVYTLDPPPIIEPSSGERGFPGQLPNCRCTMVPVYEFPNGDTE